MKLVMTALLVGFVLGSALAGEEDVLEKLRSDEPAEVAWGAYVAGDTRIDAAVPLLMERLVPNPDGDSREWQSVRRHVLDALVLLGARVSSDKLAPYMKRKHSWMPFILLAREPEKNRDIFLGQFDKWAGDKEDITVSTVATGNLLSGVRAPGFALRLLPKRQLDLTIVVRDPDDGYSGNSAMRLRGGTGDSHAEVLDGFPPYVYYDLVLVQGSVNPRTLVADGPLKVCYKRGVKTGPRVGYGGAIHYYKRAKCATEWIAEMAKVTTTEASLPQVSRMHHSWSDAEAYVAAATETRDAVLAHYWQVVRQLMKSGAVTIEEARDLEMKVVVDVKDERGDTSVPLPPLPKTTVKPNLPEKED